MLKRKKWIILLIAVIMIFIVSYYMFSILQFGRDIQEDPPPPATHHPDTDVQQPEAPPEWAGKERVNMLLLGIDAREADANGQTRSDTIMVLSIDPVSRQAQLFSVLRDTYVSIPGRGMDRINAANAYGGAELAMNTVSELLDIPIHFYVSIDFEGFIKLVDAIGGIEFEVEKNMKYTDPSDDPAYNIDLKQGLQHLDGNKALQYVRFRHDTYADFTRTERQRNIMMTVAKKMLTVTSLLKLPMTLEKIEPYIKTNLTLNEMWALGNLGYKINLSEVITEQLPPRHLLREEKTAQGAEVIAVDPVKLRSYVQEVFERVHEEDESVDEHGNENNNDL